MQFRRTPTDCPLVIRLVHDPYDHDVIRAEWQGIKTNLLEGRFFVPLTAPQANEIPDELFNPGFVCGNLPLARIDRLGLIFIEGEHRLDIAGQCRPVEGSVVRPRNHHRIGKGRRHTHQHKHNRRHKTCPHLSLSCCTPSGLSNDQ